MENRCKSCKANACCRKRVRFVQSEEAVGALAALELPRLPVKGVGGCLVPEVWLPMNDQ